VNQFVPIEFLQKSEANELCENSLKVSIDNHAINPPAPADELRQLVATLPTNTSIDMTPSCVFVDAVLEFDGSFGVNRNAFWATLQFNEVIQQCADKVVNDLRSQYRDGVHGAHLRVTDRPGLPLFDPSRGPAIFNCTVENDLDNKDSEHKLNVRFTDTGELVTMQDVFLNDKGTFPLTPSACVYVATDSMVPRIIGQGFLWNPFQVRPELKLLSKVIWNLIPPAAR
jgi:hypothetical protein